MLTGRAGVEKRCKEIQRIEVGSALNGNIAEDGLEDGARGLFGTPSATGTYI